MTSIKNSFTALLAVSLLALSSADVDLATCDSASASLNGNERTTYDILCDSDLNSALTDTTIATFVTLCSLLDSGPWTRLDGSTVNLLGFLDNTVTSTNTEHTFFAPTDAALETSLQNIWNLSVDEFLAFQDSDTSIPGTTYTQNQFFENTVPELLVQHILGDAKLTSDFICDNTYETINLVGAVNTVPTILGGIIGYGGKGTKAAYYGGDRNYSKIQKTKCRGQADTFQQIGPGNVAQLDQPTVGQPGGIFNGALFTSGNNGGNFPVSRSDNIVGCNGVIHVIDGVILPESLIPRNSKGSKSGYYYGEPSKGMKSGFFSRALRKDFPSEETDHEANRENRRARLESLLVDANGNIEPLN